MQLFDNIPFEMRSYRQFICWRLQERDGAKPTKLPLNPRTGKLASVTNSDDWGTYDEAVAASVNCSGIGFVFTKNDPFTGCDLDDTHDDAEAYARQLKVYRSLNSYSELSPSKRGLHIIVKATLPGKGRRRNSIELYDTERFFTMTGDVFNNVAIVERQEFVSILYEQMGGVVQTHFSNEDKPQTCTDEEILARASGALNGEKFQQLYQGDWQNIYPSQSEADFALVDIVAFYTQNRAQIARLFLQSALGQRDKAKRPAYVAYMVEKSFDRQLPPVDIDGIKLLLDRMIEDKRPGALSRMPGPDNPFGDQPEGDRLTASDEPTNDPVQHKSTSCNVFPVGLVGEVAQFIYDAAPRPVREIALAGAIGFLAGITGRHYNVGGSGLNQYVLLIAETGRGKEAINHGVSKLVQAIKAKGVPTIGDFVGPTQIASPQALSKWLSSQPCFYSIIGEFGLKLKEMSNPKAPPHVTGLKANMLDLYHKAGKGQVWGAMAYAKREENTAVVASPAVTIIGESTPLRFYENIDEDVVTDGLLPRFLLFEYHGDQVELKKDHSSVLPSAILLLKLAELVAQCSSQSALGNVKEVQLSPEAETIFDDFETFARNTINNRDPATGKRKATKPNHVLSELWNRAHVKATRLAALYAIGCNYINPVITADQAMLATTQVFEQTNSLRERFDSGEVGGGAINFAANEAKQLEAMARTISKLIQGSYKSKLHQYRITDDMHKAGVFPFNELLMRLQVYPVFKNDKRGASDAIRRTFALFLDNDDLREIPKPEMQKRFGKSCRAFCISNPERFLDRDII